MDYTTEKKLRPLYEALDEGQNKIALQHCTKLLKKSPDWPLVKALKALVFVRTGKEEEAFELCEQVKKAIPTDEATLQAVTMALKELGKHSLIVDLYENAANSQPKNEDFSIQWFMAMVRNNDFKGQQTAAVKLHRVFKQNKYLFWAIMSLALQGNPLSYTLAERMMAKALEEKRLEEVEHMRLYLLILMDQKKNEQALKLLLDTELGQKSLRDPEVRQIKSELLRINKRWDAVVDMSKDALENENSDDWFHWLAYFEAVDALIETNPNIIQDAEKLVQLTQNKVLDNKILKRGPFLAELDLDSRLLKIGKKDEKAVLEHIVAYFGRFGSKSCLFEDVQSYVSFLRSDAEKSRAFIDQLKQTIKPASDKPAKVKNVYTSVNVRKLERFLGLHSVSDTKSVITIINELWKEYEEALPLGDGLEKTEMQYGDDFVILAGQLLVDLYLESKDSSYLIQAASFLEVALLKSIYNFQIKLLLVRVYTLLGVYKRPFEIYKTMEIKQIQFDTMIHYFTDRYSSLGCADELENILYDALSIYKSNEVETPEMLVKAYQYGTFSKIQEFIEFRRMLDTSIQHSINNVELLHLDFLHSSFQTKYAVQFFQDQDVSQIHYDEEFIQARSDNRDFKVMSNYNAEDKLTAEQLYKPSVASNATWVQIMSFIINILSIACETKPSGKDVSAVVSGLKKVLGNEKVKNDITEPEFWLASYIAELSSAYVSVKSPKEATESLQNASRLLNEQIEKIDTFTEQTIAFTTFHKVSVALDAFNYGSILIEMMNRSLGLNSKEARRKAAEKSDDPFMVSFVNVQSDVKKLLQHIQTVAKGGKEFFRIQLQKKLYKEVVDSEHVPEYFKLKDAQNLLNNHIKGMIQSWSLSAVHISDEIDRRIQKL